MRHNINLVAAGLAFYKRHSIREFRVGKGHSAAPIIRKDKQVYALLVAGCGKLSDQSSEIVIRKKWYVVIEYPHHITRHY